jgi:hypothetical protein
MDADLIIRMNTATKSEETEHYIIVWSANKGKWELRGKAGEKTYFMKQCQYKTPLIVAARNLEEKRK